MKSIKVKNIIRECEENSLLMCKDYTMAQFSRDEVIDLAKISNKELGYDDNHNLSFCYILFEYLENNVRYADWSRYFFPDEIIDIIEITEMNDVNLIKDSIKKFKEKHK